MITGFQHMHSVLRWVVLALFVVTLVKAWQNHQLSFTPGQTKLGLFTMISMHIQLVGLALYIIEVGIHARSTRRDEVYRNAVLYLGTLCGHAVGLLFGTFGYSLTKQASSMT